MGQSLPLIDSFGRRIEYLRISLTQRCDLRCCYCYPRRQAEPTSGDTLTAEAVELIARAAARLGVRRIRLTGGEPLLREDLETIISRLAAVPGVQDLALTTNGQRLASRAGRLAAAGLRRVNVSLDSLDPEVYRSITGGGELDPVLRGIEAALAAGLSPVKINVVLASRASDGDGIAAFAELVRRRPVHVRFIEAMPTCVHAGYLPAEQALARLGERRELIPAPGPEGGGPARYYRLGDAPGMIGVIAPISAPFCAECNRLRVGADGQLSPCLFSPTGIDLLPALREADPIPHLAALIQEAVAAKPARYGDVAERTGIRAMHVIGG